MNRLAQNLAPIREAVSTGIRPVEQFRRFPRTEVARVVGAGLRDVFSAKVPG
jgi:hypothetical protein